MGKVILAIVLITNGCDYKKSSPSSVDYLRILRDTEKNCENITSATRQRCELRSTGVT